MDDANEEKQKFFLGLDIGTESVGYAMTDADYRVLRAGGKPCMGVRLFEEAQSAQSRRVFRASKVRLERAKFRITLLQELLGRTVESVDPLFFVRLKASSLWKEDKEAADGRLNTLDSLFADENYNDKSHFKRFKTIYHLRGRLADEKYWEQGVPDIRLVYLAIHHILKNRGHFFYEDINIAADARGEINIDAVGQEYFSALNAYLRDENENSSDERPSSLCFALDDMDAVVTTAKDEKLGPSKRNDALKVVLCKDIPKTEKKRAEALIKAVCGLTVKIADILPQTESIEDDEELRKGFKLGDDWEEKIVPMLSALPEEEFRLVEILKDLYNWFSLMRLLKGKGSVSEAMQEKFEDHARQLRELKQLVKKNAPEKYYKIFRSSQVEHNYAAYIGSTRCGGKAIVKKCTAEEFYKYLKAELAGILTEEILSSMGNNQYLPKLRAKDNATIPYQLHESELKRILACAQKYGIMNPDTAKKILSILSFRVPYYVGRMNPYYNTKYPDDKIRHAWIEKTVEQVKIRPWNYDQVIDLKKTGEKFIVRMLSKCTYLRGETVLPKNSLLYSEFAVRNELNNLRIQERKPSVAEKNKIYDNLFKTERSVSVRKLLTFLKSEFGMTVTESDISGIDVKGKGFNASLSSYIQVKAIFGDTQYREEEVKHIAEDVILWHALHTDKKLVESNIRDKYPHLDQERVKKLKALNFSGFGNLSQSFLEKECVVLKQTGEVTSIIRLLRDTDENLMEIIHNPLYNVEEWLKRENSKEGATVGYSDVKDSYAAPSVKRSVWQTMLVVDELISLTGKKPDKIFVEVTREKRDDQKPKKRTVSRREQLLTLWAADKGNATRYAELQNDLESATDNDLRGERLYLYFLQCGKCAYSGEAINLSEIESMCDVDHIIPQALKKDDSLTNKVLVKKKYNQLKDKKYPLRLTEAIWRNHSTLIPMWESWQKCGLMHKDKLQRLKRTTELEEKELEGFIARQFVFTGQSTTVVADLLKQKYTDSEIVYSKAENVSDFRKEFDLLKSRSMNDYHHAHDAYLNIVVGNTFRQRFAFWQKDKHKAFSQRRMFQFPVKGAWDPPKYIIKANGEKVEEIAERCGTIQTVDKYLGLKFLPVSKKIQENKGAFYKQNPLPAIAHQKEILDGRKNIEDLVVDEASLPRKGLTKNPLSNTAKYGKYSGLRPAYFMIVEYAGKQEQRIRAFTTVSILDKARWESLTVMQQHIELSEKFDASVKVIVPKILINALFEIGGMECRLSGWNGKQVLFHNAKQWFADKEIAKYLRCLSKYEEQLKSKKIKAEDYQDADEMKLSGKSGGTQTEYRLTKADNQKLWDAILSTLNKLYGGKMKALQGKGFGLPDLFDKIAMCETSFRGLPVAEQLKVLSALVRGLGCNAEHFDLSACGGKPHTGIIQPSVKISYPLTLVNQSVTGLQEHRIQIYPFEPEA